MEPYFDYNSVPHDFIHCSNQQCPHAQECLRYFVMQHLPPECETIRTITPAYPNGKECRYFLSSEKQKFARGIKHIYDNLPHQKAVEIKKNIINHFGKTLYYRIWREEYLITPAQQRYIQGVFRRKGIMEAPEYDAILNQYAWEKE